LSLLCCSSFCLGLSRMRCNATQLYRFNEHLLRHHGGLADLVNNRSEHMQVAVVITGC